MSRSSCSAVGANRYAPEYGASNLNAASLERLRYGVWLGRETGAPVAFSGGVGWMQKQGVVGGPDRRQRIASSDFGRPLRWIEDDSRDTRENAGKTMPMMLREGITEWSS